MAILLRKFRWVLMIYFYWANLGEYTTLKGINGTKQNPIQIFNQLNYLIELLMSARAQKPICLFHMKASYSRVQNKIHFILHLSIRRIDSLRLPLICTTQVSLKRGLLWFGETLSMVILMNLLNSVSLLKNSWTWNSINKMGMHWPMMAKFGCGVSTLMDNWDSAITKPELSLSH